MRSYIFTARERRLFGNWLEEKEVDATSLSKLIYRFRTFKSLEGDVDLWLRIHRRLKAEPSRAVTT